MGPEVIENESAKDKMYIEGEGTNWVGSGTGRRNWSNIRTLKSIKLIVGRIHSFAPSLITILFSNNSSCF